MTNADLADEIERSQVEIWPREEPVSVYDGRVITDAEKQQIIAALRQPNERELAKAQARIEELQEILLEMTEDYSQKHDSEFGVSDKHAGEALEIVIRARAALSREPRENDPNTLTLQGVEAGNMLFSMQGPPELLSGKPHEQSDDSTGKGQAPENGVDR